MITSGDTFLSDTERVLLYLTFWKTAEQSCRRVDVVCGGFCFICLVFFKWGGGTKVALLYCEKVSRLIIHFRSCWVILLLQLRTGSSWMRTNCIFSVHSKLLLFDYRESREMTRLHSNHSLGDRATENLFGLSFNKLQGNVVQHCRSIFQSISGTTYHVVQLPLRMLVSEKC